MAGEDFNKLLQEAASKLIARASRWEIPDPVVKQFAGQTAEAVGKVSRLLGMDNPEEELKAAFGVDPNASIGVQADQIANSISAAVDSVWPRLTEGNLPDEGQRDFGSRAEPRDEHLREAVANQLDELFKDNPEPFKEFAAFEEEVGPTNDDPLPLPARWRLEPVKNILTRMLAFSREVAIDDPDRAVKYPHRIRFEDSLALEIELMHLDTRFELAKQLAEQARQNPDLRNPGRAVGNDVHTVLQDRYLMARSPSNVIIQEWWIYFPGRRHRRTITEQAERELRNPDPQKRDYTFVVIEMARLPKRGPISGKNRWDALDLSLAQLYEIKPLVRMQEGVLQESYYRYKYCFCALYLLDPELSCRVLVPWVDPGKMFPISDPSTHELLIHARHGAIAIPINVIQALPGVVPYVVLRRNTRTDLVRLRLRVQVWLRETYTAIKKQLQEIRADILIGILVIILFVLVIVLVLVVVGKALVGSPQPSKQLPAPSEQPVPTIGEPSRDPVFSPGSVGTPTFISVRPGANHKSLKVIIRAESAMTETVHFGIGGLEVEGLPVSRFGEFMTKAVDGIDTALAHLTRMAPPSLDDLLDPTKSRNNSANV